MYKTMQVTGKFSGIMVLNELFAGVRVPRVSFVVNYGFNYQ